MNLQSQFQITNLQNIAPVFISTEVLNFNKLSFFIEFAFKNSLNEDDTIDLGPYRFVFKSQPKFPNEIDISNPYNDFIEKFNLFWPARKYYQAQLLEVKIRVQALNIGSKWNILANVELPTNSLALPIVYRSGSSPDLIDEKQEFAIYEKVGIAAVSDLVINSSRNWLEPFKLYQHQKEKGLFASSTDFQLEDKPLHLPSFGGINQPTPFAYQISRSFGSCYKENETWVIEPNNEAQTTFIIPQAKTDQIPAKLSPTDALVILQHTLPEKWFAFNKPILGPVFLAKGNASAWPNSGGVLTIIKTSNYEDGSVTSDFFLEENVENSSLWYSPSLVIAPNNITPLENFILNLSVPEVVIANGMDNIKFNPVADSENWESFVFLNLWGVWETIFLKRKSISTFISEWRNISFYPFLKDASTSLFWRKFQFVNNQWITQEIKAKPILVPDSSNSFFCLTLEF